MTHTVVLEQLLDEVDVCEDHPSTAITLQLQLVKRITRHEEELNEQKKTQA